MSFVHLHVHTEYSLLDGSAKISEIMGRVKALGMDSVAITDHGSMFGVIDFYKAAREAGVKPILGCEVYVAAGSRFDKDVSESHTYHLVLLAENNTGYQNLTKLVSFGYTEGFYYRPRVDLELLRQYNEGIICLSACLSGPLSRNLLNGAYDVALQQAETYLSIFGRDRFFVELQENGLEDQKTANEGLVKIARALDLQMVATNDSHYLLKEDAKAHEVLLCIQTGKTMLDPDRMAFDSNEFYIKSPEEMTQAFAWLPEALENTVKIAERCNVEIEFGKHRLPRYDLPPGRVAGEYLREITYAGLAGRYGEITDEIAARADYELEMIDKMGFNEYFLVTWDFIRFAGERGIAVGPGRGSAAGSLVVYALRITNIDPLAHNLLFERFLNPERVSMPDIDIDFCYERRQEVIDYVVNKYGQERVAQIITFGTMGAKAVVRDVGRGLGMPYAEVDVIAKMIPFAIGMTIGRAMELSPDLRADYAENDRTRELIDMARRLEGLPRHASTHAAGVVISDAPLTNYIPLNTNDGVITTQFPMNTLEELGLPKMDFLGLRTLTVIRHTVEEVRRRRGIEIDIDAIDLDDRRVYESICAGRTEGMFQLESRGMTSFMKDLKPSCIEDLTAGISLFRPGPMDFIPKYVRSKNSGAKVTYTHPSLEPILRETYGCIVYQEQVMRIVRDLAGYSMGRSDLLRRAMSKKESDVMNQEKAHFINGIEGEVPGCVANGIPATVAERIFDEMTDFAKYAFPKGHGAAYALIGYQTAWLKTHYPTEFMAALLTSVMDNIDNIGAYAGTCKNLGITVLPPDVNESFGHFTVASETQIRFGMNAIKNLGRPTVAAVVAERERSGRFKSLADLINRLEEIDLNKRGVESLIKSGAMTSLGGNRRQHMNVFEQLLTGAAANRKRNLAGQLSLLDMDFSDAVESHQDLLPDLPEFDLKRLLADEKEVMGIYVSGHPLQEFEAQLKQHVNAYSTDFAVPEGDEGIEEQSALADGQIVTVGGIITKKNIVYTRRTNEPMCFLTIEDNFGIMETVVFPKIFHVHSKELPEGRAVMIEGKVSLREDRGNALLCDKIHYLDKIESKSVLWLKISKEVNIETDSIINVLSRYGGDVPVVIYEEKTGQRRRVSEKYLVNCHNENLLDELKGLLGERNVVLK